MCFIVNVLGYLIMMEAGLSTAFLLFYESRVTFYLYFFCGRIELGLFNVEPGRTKYMAGISKEN